MEQLPPSTHISIDEIDYDAENPRIQLAFDQGREKNDATIRLALGAEPPDEDTSHGTTIQGLRRSILANGGIIQPIIVKKKDDGRYVVVEGNTRLMIYREYRDRGFKGDWTKIPAVCHDDIDQFAIDSIRLQSHLVGPRQWSPYSKARYLAQLQKSGEMPWEDVISFCGGNTAEITELVSAYYDMEDFYRPIIVKEAGKFDPTRFSTFVVLQQRRISGALIDAGYSKHDYAAWVHTKKIFPSQDARQLARILKNDKAHEIFLRDGSKAALNFLNALKEDEDDRKLGDAPLELLAKEILQRLLKMTREEEAELRSNPDGDVALVLVQLESELEVLCGAIRSD